MTIDEIIARLRNKFPGAGEFLDRLIIQQEDGDTKAWVQWGVCVQWNNAHLQGPDAEHVVTERLQDAIVVVHRDMESIARAMGISEGILHPDHGRDAAIAAELENVLERQESQHQYILHDCHIALSPILCRLIVNRERKERSLAKQRRATKR